MNAIALGPLLIALPRLYAFIAALVLLLLSLAVLRLDKAQRAGWFNGLMLAWLLGARLGYVMMHADSYLAAPLDILKLWQPGYSPVWGLLAAAVWSSWKLRDHLTTLIKAKVLLAASVALWLGLVAWNPLGHDTGLDELPDLVLEDLEGNEVNLHDMQGEPLVLNLWATWCPPCRREMPLLAEADDREGVRVVVVNQGETLLAATRYLDSQGLDFDQALLDPEQRLMVMVESPGLPTSLLFDAQGRLVERHVGELTRAQLDAWLER
ncbi:Thiol-disulfide isomerase or thioredoxin [Modicisalibacter ilicicola DSM 19980]|uniref:Thiol-disulfide isomerase or thioredoxin n=1 Tax=Modicisalibacter ilicicola DSM 19980 TaxID=1121942 RepID=A0A1M5DFR1_9GAMM|nr:TlpA disulfide reductase family protein [Halomonas ilicicola]SHF65704.1 Thiol-disulfide isomerase or thioredoxin [Halomonas ilicicola DSM 19980]